MKLTQKDIKTYATEDEKEFLKEWVGEKHMNFEEYKKKLKGMSYPELVFARKDAYETAKIHDQMEKDGLPNNAGYYWDEVHMIAQEMKSRPFGHDSFGPFAENIEKKYLKESVADSRSMQFIQDSGGDIDVWEKMILKMTPRQMADAEFELRSARDGITWYIRKWTIPSEHREEMKKRRKLYQLYLNRIRKVINSKDQIKYDDFGDEIKEHPDYDPTRDQDIKFESKKLTEAKNEKGKTRKIDNPYEVYNGYGALQDWVWKVLKHYQAPDKERSNPYARVFCAVSSPFTFGGYDYGDVYCKDIPGYKYE